MREMRLSLRAKLFLSLISIALVLLISSIISVLEYGRMSSYISDMIADNIESINAAQKLYDDANSYNLAVLSVVGDESSNKRPGFDEVAFKSRCDSLRSSAPNSKVAHLADSVQYSYAAYMLTSFELEDVLASDFIDTRSWYFERLQPRYNRLRHDIDALSNAIYEELADNSETFQGAFYRSIIPGIIAVGVGLLLVLMLLFFLESNYSKPIYRMLSSLKNYRNYQRDYTYDFNGEDQLHDLNTEIKQLAEENKLLKKRISAMKKSETAK
ncbi:MAG: hypothetical protein IKZ71_05090 [Bacteroidales bacterium]|jgi:predicted PurR-regulated permease PerM|nr:hypothetical protein [Bacteroidales bacterium]